MTASAAPSGATATTILMAGGGSGGHISPGLAIAERLETAASDVRTVFACSDRPIDAHMLREAGARFFPISARPPSPHPVRAWRFVRAFVRARRQCVELIRSAGVDRVVALGGFVAAPAVAAARRVGVPVTLLNLDRPPGKANRWIARRCDEVWTAIDLPDAPGFASRTVGMPIRRRALAPAPAAECRRRLGLDPDRPTLLVTGASQGAGSINGLMPPLVEAHATDLAPWQVCHLAGDAGAPATRDAYARLGVAAIVEPFLDEIGLAWGAADVAISRAGASSVAEAAANGVPTIFLPYPYHRDAHQRRNAQPLVDLGAAIIVDDQIEPAANVASTAPALLPLLGDPERRAEMRRRLREHHGRDAASAIAELLLGRRGSA